MSWRLEGEDIESARRQYRESQGNGSAAPQPTFSPIDLADVARWRGVEPPELTFAVEDLVPLGMVSLFTGIGGSGKTLLLQLLCSCISASMLSFLGKAAISGAAAGVFGEDPEAVLHIRQPRINAYLGIDYDRIAGRCFLQSYFGTSAQLWSRGAPTPFFGELELALARINALRILVLDNVAVLFAGDENSRAEVTAFLQALNGLADRLGIAVVLSAHASKSQDGTALRVTSGSTAWVNACRSVLELTPGDDEQGPALTVVKANHAATGTTIPLVWQDKLLVPEGTPSGLARASGKQKAERVFLALLDKVTSEGRYVSDSSNAGNFAPRVFLRRSENEGCKLKDFITAMESLFAHGSIVVRLVGRKGHEKSTISRIERGGPGGL